VKTSGKIKIRFRILIFIAIAALALSCEKKIGTIKKSDILNLPGITVKNSESVFSDSCLVQLIITFPLMEKYDNSTSPYSEFRSGIKVIFYDGHKEPVGSVTSKYAKFYENKKLWELKDSVIAINEQNYKLETELLYWDQEKELIYTDRFVKITSEDQIVMGTGFESDPRLSTRKIKNVNATIYLKDEQ
jgi:LPS export ABC transporter protein LptC